MQPQQCRHPWQYFRWQQYPPGWFPYLPNDVVIAGATPVGTTSYPVCKNIIVENNLIKNSTHAALQICSATNDLAVNNTIESPNQWNDSSSVLGCVMVQKCAEVVMNNNHLVLDPGVTSYKTNIYQDATATPNVF